MTLFQFLGTFILMLLIGSPVIVGWYVITRGEWFMQPDATWKKYGMIFKEWSLFWEQYRHEDKVYFQGEFLDKKIDLLEKVRPDIGEDIFLSNNGLYMHTSSRQMPSPKILETMADIMQCEIEEGLSGNFKGYIREPRYMFPSWVRKPMSECLACMSSVYGSLFYWFMVLQAKGLFGWAEKENLAKLGFWVIFCLFLACGNKYLEQKMKL